MEEIKRFEFTEEHRQGIISLLNSRSYLKIRALLNQLKEIKKNEIQGGEK